ncbi:MAG: outer membrane lipoprotein-sorting protein [Candidatus Bipolaricaulota bacterium]|nr:outer membrane lipoprotein-sorting protein [Candidatus Bipolaricaulota bacterium]MDW8126418.1 outer membrane lipoprotein-sorting protein [Candidatus Bipolaricaulota bacterium]
MKRLVGVLAVLFGVLALAQTAEEILERVEEQGFFGTGRGSLYAALVVEIQEKGQPTVDYAFRVWAKEYPDGTVKFLLLYAAPADVAGTLFLAHVPEEGTAQMWLYLPELALLKELKGEAERKGEFLAGSGITYEDISKGFSYREGYMARLIGEETVDVYPVWKLELVPKGVEAEWFKIFLWVHRSEYIVVRAEFYDKDGKLARILTVPELVTDEVGTRPAFLRVEDLLKGSWAEVRIPERSTADIPDTYFEPANLPYLSF